MTEGKIIEGVRCISVSDATAATGISYDRFLHLIRIGEVVGYERGHHWYVGVDSLYLCLGYSSRPDDQSGDDEFVEGQYADVEVTRSSHGATAESQGTRAKTAVIVDHARSAFDTVTSNVPLYAVGPGVDLLHRAAVGLMAVLLVVGAYRFVQTEQLNDFALQIHPAEMTAASGNSGAVSNFMHSAGCVLMNFFDHLPGSAHIFSNGKACSDGFVSVIVAEQFQKISQNAATSSLTRTEGNVAPVRVSTQGDGDTFNGVVTLDKSGSARVAIPEEAKEFVTFRYQLTPLLKPQPGLYIKQEAKAGVFVIAGGAPGSKVSWQIIGIGR